MIVADTNVVSELMRPAPSPALRAWMSRQAAGDLYTTAITVAEIRYGLERLPGGRRQDRLRAAADEVFAAFNEFVLPFEAGAAVHYARIARHRGEAGLPISGPDAQIAAICRVRGAALACGAGSLLSRRAVWSLKPWYGKHSIVFREPQSSRRLHGGLRRARGVQLCPDM